MYNAMHRICKVKTMIQLREELFKETIRKDSNKSGGKAWPVERLSSFLRKRDGNPYTGPGSGF